MIAIIDNGNCYSDHAIWFVDVGDEDPKLVARMIACDPYYYRAHALASAPSFEWYAGEPAKLSDKLPGLWGMDAEDLEDADSDALAALLRLRGDICNRALVLEVLAARGVHT